MPVASIVVPNNFTYAFYTTKWYRPESVCIHHLELDVIDPECPYYHIGSSHYFHSSQKSKTVKPTLFLQLRLCIVNIVLQLGLIVLMIGYKCVNVATNSMPNGLPISVLSFH